MNDRLYLCEQRLNQHIQGNAKGYLKGWWKNRNKNVCIYRAINLNGKFFNIEKAWKPIVSIIKMIVLQQKSPAFKTLFKSLNEQYIWNIKINEEIIYVMQLTSFYRDMFNKIQWASTIFKI
jgi:hypothetical protein